MTAQEWAMLASQVGGGVFGGVAQSQQNKRGQQNQQQQQLDAVVQRMLASLQNAQQTGQNLQTNRQQMPQTQAELSPLGQEQSFLQKQRMLQTLLPTLANFQGASPTDAGVAGSYRPQSNILANLANPKLMESVGDGATAQSLADRRKLMAQINPDYEFSSLGGFGLDPRFDDGVNRASQDAGARLRAYESAQSALADQQIGLSNQQLQNAQQAGQQQEKKGGGIGGFLGGVLKTAAPFAAFIPGVGAPLAIGLGAAGGALGNKMQGGGLLSGAVQGGIGAGIGAAGKSLASGQGLNPFNNGAGKVLNNSMTAASLPQMGIGAPGPGPQLQLPNSMQPSLTPFAQGAQQQAPNIGRVVSGGGKSPAAPSGPPAKLPFVSSHAPRANPMGGQNIDERSFWNDINTPLIPQISELGNFIADGIDRPTLPMTPYPWANEINAMGKGFLAGATQGVGDTAAWMTSPLGIASSVAGPAASAVSKAARPTMTALPQAMSAFKGMPKAPVPMTTNGLGSFPGLGGVAQAQAAQAIVPAEHAIAEGMMAMGRTGKALPSTGNAINQSLQRFYKQVPGQVTESISPSMLARIVSNTKAPARTATRAAKKKVKK